MAAKTDTSDPNPAPTAAGRGLDSVLQHYIRQLHNAKARYRADGEPARGKDPWLGLMA